MLIRLVVVVAVMLGAAADAAPNTRQAALRADNRLVLGERLGAYRYVEASDSGRGYVAAVEAFGRPSTRGSLAKGNICTVRWTRLGLDIRFASRLGHPCALRSLRKGTWHGMILHAERWWIDRGLRVADSEARLRGLYPQARRFDKPPASPTYWLRTDFVEGRRTPLLTAEVWDGRVASVTVEVGFIS